MHQNKELTDALFTALGTSKKERILEILTNAHGFKIPEMKSLTDYIGVTASFSECHEKIVLPLQLIQKRIKIENPTQEEFKAICKCIEMANLTQCATLSQDYEGWVFDFIVMAMADKVQKQIEVQFPQADH